MAEQEERKAVRFSARPPARFAKGADFNLWVKRLELYFRESPNMDDIANHIIANPSLANLRYELLISLQPLEHSSSIPEAMLLPLLWPSDWSCYISLSHMYNVLQHISDWSCHTLPSSNQGYHLCAPHIRISCTLLQVLHILQVLMQIS